MIGKKLYAVVDRQTLNFRKRKIGGLMTYDSAANAKNGLNQLPDKEKYAILELDTKIAGIYNHNYSTNKFENANHETI